MDVALQNLDGLMKNEGTRHTINIVVAINDNVLLSVYRIQNSPDCRIHVRQPERIVKTIHGRMKEIVCALDTSYVPVGQN
jgi:hypothetical protein